MIDAAQTQAIAKGGPSASKVLTPKAYDAAVIEYVNRPYAGASLGVSPCEEERRLNSMRSLNLFSLDSINGFGKVSELLASINKR